MYHVPKVTELELQVRGGRGGSRRRAGHWALQAPRRRPAKHAPAQTSSVPKAAACICQAGHRCTGRTLPGSLSGSAREAYRTQDAARANCPRRAPRAGWHATRPPVPNTKPRPPPCNLLPPGPGGHGQEDRCAAQGRRAQREPAVPRPVCDGRQRQRRQVLRAPGGCLAPQPGARAALLLVTGSAASGQAPLPWRLPLWHALRRTCSWQLQGAGACGIVPIPHSHMPVRLPRAAAGPSEALVLAIDTLSPCATPAPLCRRRRRSRPLEYGTGLARIPAFRCSQRRAGACPEGWPAPTTVRNAAGRLCMAACCCSQCAWRGPRSELPAATAAALLARAPLSHHPRLQGWPRVCLSRPC